MKRIIVHDLSLRPLRSTRCCNGLSRQARFRQHFFLAHVSLRISRLALKNCVCHRSKSF
jgi:hypothetical protein